MKLKYIKAHLLSAMNYAELSYAKRRKVGSMLVKGDYILTYGYNGRPAGDDNNCEINEDTTHPEVIHAEDNMLRKLYRLPVSSEGAYSFQTDAPCLPCASKLIDAGVAAVFYLHPYRLTDGIEKLTSKGIEVYHVILTNGRVSYEDKDPTFGMRMFKHLPNGVYFELLPDIMIQHFS